MGRRVTNQQMMEGMKAKSNIDFNDLYVNLKVDATTTTREARVRFIGLPIEFREAQRKVRDPENPKATIEKDFPDAQLNKKFTRICYDDPSECPWTKMGYVSNKQFAYNVIDKTDKKNTKVRILKKGTSVFGEIGKIENFNMLENKQTLEDHVEGDEEETLLWEVAGGTVAQDAIITVNFDAFAKGVKYSYSVRFTGKATEITDAEIEMLRAVHEPTADELKTIRKSSPDLKDVPDWFFYGYDLDNWFKPEVPRTEVKPTPEEELEVDVSDDDDEDDTVATDDTEAADTEVGEDLPKLW